MNAVLPYVAAVVPTIVVAAFFYAIIKRIIEGDRRERMAQRRLDAEEDARAQRPDTTASDLTGPEDPPA